MAVSVNCRQLQGAGGGKAPDLLTRDFAPGPHKGTAQPSTLVPYMFVALPFN